MSETNLRPSKRRRTERNPFIDLEAIVDEDEEIEDEVEISESFVVDDTTEPNDYPPSEAQIFTANCNEDVVNDQFFEQLIQRARNRAKTEPQPTVHDQLGTLRIMEGDAVQDRVLSITRDEVGALKWVRMRRIKGKLGIYVGDLALAISTPEPTEFEYWLIPRPRISGQVKGVRPIQRFFIASMALEQAGQDGSKAQVPNSTFIYKGDLYSLSGFLIIRGPSTLAASYNGQVLPTPYEFDFFTACEALEFNFQCATKLRIAQNVLNIGDRVRCVGELQGLVGLIQDMSEDNITIHIPSMDIIETVMRYEVRKEFRIGDLVSVSSEDQDDKPGWVVSVNDRTVSVLDLKNHVEIDCSWQQLRFSDERASIRDLCKISSLSFEDRRSMRYNPNAKYIGRPVMVVGANIFKAVKGTIRDVTLDGHAFVSLDLFNHPQREKFKLFDLRLILNNNLVDIGGSEKPIETAASPFPPDVTEESIVGTSMHTPFTPTGDGEPSSRTPETPHSDVEPEPIIPTWMADPKMRGLRIVVAERHQTNENKAYEVKNIINDVVTVRDGMKSKQFALGEIVPCVPTRTQDVVVSFEPGEYFGQIFRMKEFGPKECILRKYGVRKTTQVEKLYHLRTKKLCVIYPSKKL